MNVNNVETSKLRLSTTANIVLYSLPDNDIKAIAKRVKGFVKQLIDGNPKTEGAVYQLSYKNLIVLLKKHNDHLEMMDIVNHQVYHPRNGFSPYVL